MNGEVGRAHTIERMNLSSYRWRKSLWKASQDIFLLPLKRVDTKNQIALLTGYCCLEFYLENIGVVFFVKWSEKETHCV